MDDTGKGSETINVSEGRERQRVGSEGTRERHCKVDDMCSHHSRWHVCPSPMTNIPQPWKPLQSDGERSTRIVPEGWLPRFSSERQLAGGDCTMEGGGMRRNGGERAVRGR